MLDVSERASETQTYMTDARCEAKKHGGEKAADIAGRSSLLDESERASEKQTYMTDTRCEAKKLDGERATVL